MASAATFWSSTAQSCCGDPDLRSSAPLRSRRRLTMPSLLVLILGSCVLLGAGCSRNAAQRVHGPSNVVGAGRSFFTDAVVKHSQEGLTGVLAELAAFQAIIVESQDQMARRLSSLESVLSRELVALSGCACSGSRGAGRSASVLGEPCSSSLDCSSRLAGAVCSSRGLCVCDDGFWTEDNVSCNRTVGTRGACTTDRQCSGDLVCFRGQCSCPVTEVGSYQYRLSGGPSCIQGRVEVSHRHSGWGVVCDDYWNNTAAAVICRSLGFVSGTAEKEAVRYGASGRFFLDDVMCNGAETSLFDCQHRPWGKHDCGSTEVAGVTCDENNTRSPVK